MHFQKNKVIYPMKSAENAILFPSLISVAPGVFCIMGEYDPKHNKLTNKHPSMKAQYTSLYIVRRIIIVNRLHAPPHTPHYLQFNKLQDEWV